MKHLTPAQTEIAEMIASDGFVGAAEMMKLLWPNPKDRPGIKKFRKHTKAGKYPHRKDGREYEYNPPLVFRHLAKQMIGVTK